MTIDTIAFIKSGVWLYLGLAVALVVVMFIRDEWRDPNV